MYQKLVTNKLFYDKWPYKITCKVPGITLLRSFGFKYICSLTDQNIFNHNWHRYNKFNLTYLKNFINLADIYINDENIKRRIERNIISFYFLTKDKFDEFLEKLNQYIISVSEPLDNTNLDILQKDNRYIICDQLPHKKFKFKITFKDMPPNIRKNLILWAEKYNNDDIYITKSTKIHFHGIKYHYGAHYFYIRDPKMISFITLAAAGYIRRIDKFITREFLATV